MRRLDFLVPHWHETPELMEPLLDSIKVQRVVDLSQVGVIIAYDGPDASELPLDEWRERYPFAIEDVHPDKGGVSHTRNAALKASKAEYVIFTDADDCLMDNRGLFVVFREMDADPNPVEMQKVNVPRSEWKKGFDFLLCDFVEETKTPDGRLDYVPHQNNSTFVHSQVARRQWLLDNDLLFADALTCHEDSYWVIRCREIVKPWRGKLCQFPWFLWAWNGASTCRHSPDTYILSTMPNMIESNAALVDDFIRRGMTDRASTYFVMQVFDVYYMLNKPEWIRETNKDYRDRVERDFVAHFRAHYELWDDMPNQQKMMISQGVRQRSVMEGMLLEALTCQQWLNRILEKYPE